jgi:c-di-GMP-binding flagellar brake protein YcgR
MDAVRNERRRHPRYRVNKDVLSINQDILAEVIEISKCGMSCRCLTSTARPLTSITEIELLNCDHGTSVENLHCRMVRSSKKSISGAFTSTQIMHFSLEFQLISKTQRRQLDRFIADNSLFEADVSFH